MGIPVTWENRVESAARSGASRGNIGAFRASEIIPHRGPCFLHSTLAVNDPMGAPPNRRPVATAHVGLNQPVDHESWRDVDTVLATPSRVDAARMQRTITPEYMCQGCD